jgi:hypothetical protein
VLDGAGNPWIAVISPLARELEPVRRVAHNRVDRAVGYLAHDLEAVAPVQGKTWHRRVQGRARQGMTVIDACAIDPSLAFAVTVAVPAFTPVTPPVVSVRAISTSLLENCSVFAGTVAPN